MSHRFIEFLWLDILIGPQCSCRNDQYFSSNHRRINKEALGKEKGFVYWPIVRFDEF